MIHYVHFMSVCDLARVWHPPTSYRFHSLLFLGLHSWRRAVTVPVASPRAVSPMFEVLAVSFSYPLHMRAGGQSSPSPSHLPTDSVWSVYPSYLSWLGDAGGAVISNQIYALAGI